MLTTLIESKAHRQRDHRGAGVSVILHSAIILAAVYATASGSANESAITEPRLHWIPTKPAPQSLTHSASSETPSAPRSLPRVVPIPIVLPSGIPAVGVSTVPVTSNDFPPGNDTISGGSEGRAGLTGGDRRAYDASEVETPVTSKGAAAPDYPAMLRASGIEGRVQAEFVVTESGRADVESLRVISTANDLFSDAVRRALPRMRFNPARIGGRPVAQLVRQEFVFKLDR